MERQQNSELPRAVPMANASLPKEVSSVDILVKYRTETLELIKYTTLHAQQSAYQRCDKKYQLYAQLISLPSWWHRSITEVRLTLQENFPPADFLSYFPAVRHVKIQVANQATANSYLNKFIIGLPRVDTIFIEGSTISPAPIVVGDLVLEDLMRRSWNHPIAFPRFEADQNFSLGQILRFLELANICPSQLRGRHIYTWELRSPVRGKREDWQDWIRRNAEPDDFGFGEKCTSKYFKFRGIMHSVDIHHFID